MANKLSTTRKTTKRKSTKSTVTRTKKTKVTVAVKKTTKRKTATVTKAKKSKGTIARKAKTNPKTAKSTVRRAKKSKVANTGKTTTKSKPENSTPSHKPYPKNRSSKKDFKWDQLPNVPFEKICSFLWNSASCYDLASLRQVNRRVKVGVDGFMALSSNRPRLESIVFEMRFGGIYMQFNVHKINIPFYDMTHLDKKKFKRASEERDGFKVCTLRVFVRKNTDPILDQARFLLSTTYRAVFVFGLRDDERYSIISALLGSATINKWYFVRLPLVDDGVGEKIVSLTTQTSTNWCIVKTEKVTLTDPGAFINGLDSQLSDGMKLRKTRGTATNLFGMSIHFWEPFLNEKLRGGSGVWVDKMSLTKTPLDISRFDLNVVEWSSPIPN